MKKSLLLPIAICSLCVVLAMPVCAFAQSNAASNQTVVHHHYKLIEIGTLGGPVSFLSGPEEQVLNDQGTFAAFANTATPNPNANCFVPFNNRNVFFIRRSHFNS
jgi:hypothetical protein